MVSHGCDGADRALALSHAADYTTMASRLAALHKKWTVERRLPNSEAVETTPTVSNVTGSIVEGMVDRRS